MSRIGKKPVPIPKGVDVRLEGGTVTAKGPKGTLSCDVPPGSTVELSKDELVVQPAGQSRQARASWGLCRSLLNNLVLGVSEGFSKSLMITGTGYRCEQKKIDGRDWLQFALGFSHPILFEVPDGVSAETQKSGRIVLQSADKELLGQVAATIRSFRPPEPYKGKGIRYEGEHVRRKVGKAGAR